MHVFSYQELETVTTLQLIMNMIYRGTNTSELLKLKYSLKEPLQFAGEKRFQCVLAFFTFPNLAYCKSDSIIHLLLKRLAQGAVDKVKTVKLHLQLLRTVMRLITSCNTASSTSEHNLKWRLSKICLRGLMLSASSNAILL